MPTIVHLQRLTDLNKEQQWSSGIQGILREAIHQSKTKPLAEIDKADFKRRLHDALEENVSKYERKGGNDFLPLQNGLIN